MGSKDWLGWLAITPSTIQYSILWFFNLMALEVSLKTPQSLTSPPQNTQQKPVQPSTLIPLFPVKFTNMAYRNIKLPEPIIAAPIFK